MWDRVGLRRRRMRGGREMRPADDRYAVVSASVVTVAAIATSAPTAIIAFPSMLPVCVSRGLLCGVEMIGALPSVLR
jgi:hypothetical protein